MRSPIRPSSNIPSLNISSFLVPKIKEKEGLQKLDDDFVQETITEFLKKNKKIAEKIGVVTEKQFLRTREYAELKKSVRKALRETYGVFDLDEKAERGELLAKLRASPDDDPDRHELIRELLALHQSTKERLPYYTKYYTELFKSIGEPSADEEANAPHRFLDIGCGMNPLSVGLLENEQTENIVYHCCDISSEDVRFLDEYYQATPSLQGTPFVCDAIKSQEALLSRVEELRPDCIIMLKLLDTLETIERHSTKKLLPQLAELMAEESTGKKLASGGAEDAQRRARWLVVSFATQSLGGNKRIGDEKRSWFEKYLEKQRELAGWSWETFSLPNEKFYVIKV